MKYIRAIWLITFLAWAEISSAQTNNLWPVHHNQRVYHQSAYYFDETGKFNFVPFLTSAPIDTFASSWPLTISNWNGSASLYSDRQDVFINGTRIGNSNVYQSEMGDLLYSTRESFIFAPCDTANFLLIIPITKSYGFNFFNDTGSGFVSYTFIQKDVNHSTGYSIPSGASNKRIEYTNETVLGCATTRNLSGQLVLVVRTTNNLYSYVWNYVSQEFDPLDSISTLFLSNSPNPLYTDKSQYRINKLSGWNSPALSSRGDKLAFPINYEVLTNTGGKVVEVVSIVKQFDFDRNTGKFSNPIHLYLHKWDLSMVQPPENNFIVVPHLSYSPNGDQIYLNGTEYRYNDNLNRAFGNSFRTSNQANQFCDLVGYKIFQIDKYGGNRIEVARTGHFLNHLNHLGELIFMPEYNQSEPSAISRIKHPNLKSPDFNLTPKTDFFPIGYSPSWTNRLMYDYNRISYTIDYSCIASVRFKNTPDPGINFSSFKWHFLDEDGNPIVKTDQNPVITYSKNGDYPYMLLSQSNDGSGYGEWYVDTLKIRIPEKPVASFTASDIVVCRYADLFFNNSSFAKDSIINTYTWHFGDGITSNLFSPGHAYSTSGTYSVSLFYSNGYCDSTLVKNQYIQVVDAPKPGIEITATDGCAPLLIAITDTQTVSVVKKEYFYSDIGIWQEEVDPIVSHQFDISGNYMIIEYLLGYSGCVVYDTAYIHVKNGLSDKDTFNVLNATRDGLNSLVYWQGNKAAMEYSIYKQSENGSPILWKTTRDTFIVDVDYKSGDGYFINGIDSCGGKGVRYRPGKPVVLSGVVIGMNESAQLDFTKYESWEGGIRYELQKWKNGSWIVINQSTNAGTIFDPDFAEDDTLRACYRIVSYQPTNPDIQSASNVFCLELVPQIWVPNAFTPNKNGLNERFFPVMLGVETIEMQIFNQWGQLVFEGENTSWDGTFLNYDAPSGVYLVMYSVVTAQGTRIHNKKVIHLIR